MGRPEQAVAKCGEHAHRRPRRSKLKSCMPPLPMLVDYLLDVSCELEQSQIACK